jgi:hypothetical protein
MAAVAVSEMEGLGTTELRLEQEEHPLAPTALLAVTVVEPLAATAGVVVELAVATPEARAVTGERQAVQVVKVAKAMLLQVPLVSLQQRAVVRLEDMPLLDLMDQSQSSSHQHQHRPDLLPSTKPQPRRLYLRCSVAMETPTSGTSQEYLAESQGWIIRAR